jgi:Xaa-Pro aminopeptidase
MVLLDFGIQYGEINTDVSRTLPCSGRFNPLQSLLYRIVLDTQAFNQKNVRPGITIRQLNQSAWQYLEKRLASDFFALGGQARRPYEIQPHGISHLLGIQVHEGDPMRLYEDTPLKAGWIISNEPGIYGWFGISIGGRRFRERLGIRIEDDLLVTARGCVNLTASIPKSQPLMEKLTRKT